MSKQETALPVITDGLSPKGGLKAGVAKAMRKQAFDWIEAQGFERTQKGRFTKAIADVDGTVAYMVVDVVVSNDSKLFDAPAEKKAKPAATDVTDVPDLAI